MAIKDVGLQGERMAMEYLIRNNIHCMQPDVIGRDKYGNYFILEVKHQDMFRAPPFDGHGLPPYQVKARLDFQKKTGIRAIFFVIEKNTNNIYIKPFDILEKGKKFLTKTGSRVIYDINNFQKRNLKY